MMGSQDDGRYVRIFKTDKGYKFEVYPKNKLEQRLGKSCYFTTEKECNSAVKILKELILDKNICIESKYVRIEEEHKSYRYVCYNYSGKAIFFQRFVNKENAKSGIDALRRALVAAEERRQK